MEYWRALNEYLPAVGRLTLASTSIQNFRTTDNTTSNHNSRVLSIDVVSPQLDNTMQ